MFAPRGSFPPQGDLKLTVSQSRSFTLMGPNGKNIERITQRSSGYVLAFSAALVQKNNNNLKKNTKKHHFQKASWPPKDEPKDRRLVVW